MTWKGNEIHYTDEGEGPVILMIHGLGGTFYNFQDIAELLKNDYRIIRVDIPGMGLSDFKQVTGKINLIEAFSGFFKHIIEHLDLKSMYVIGNSLGGMMAWIIAINMPERLKGLVLISSAGYEVDKVIIDAAGPARWKWFGFFLKKGLPRVITNFALSRPFADKSKVNPQEYDIQYTVLNREDNIQTLLSLATSINQAPDPNLIKQVQAPTLIIWGQEDPIIPVRHAAYFHRDIAQSQVKIYSPCGHMAMMEQPEKVVADFKEFVLGL